MGRKRKDFCHECGAFVAHCVHQAQDDVARHQVRSSTNSQSRCNQAMERPADDHEPTYHERLRDGFALHDNTDYDEDE